jgi:peptidoglycan-N-acetylglucosamine deacetylase
MGITNGTVRKGGYLLSVVWFFMLAVILYGVYAPLAELIFHIWHVGTFYRGNQNERKISLTFDDGPDERYTPQILDILKENDVKATFFLVGEKAEKHPELVRRIVSDGHELAAHSYRHKHAWLRDPIGTYRDILRSKLALEQISGQRVRFYRPPWGAFNWMTRFACIRLGLQPVLWSVRAIDWLPGEYVDHVIRRVVLPAKPGAIVLCHDAGGAPEAPLNTIRAMPTIIGQLKSLGFSFATVGELYEAVETRRREPIPYQNYPLFRRCLIHVWSIVEWAFARVLRIVPVNQIFRISPITWRFGDRVDAESGKLIVRDGAKAMDIHFQNDTLMAISNEGDNKALVRALKLTRNGLKDLARLVEHHPQYQDVEVFCAVTLMNKGIEMLGFHVEELPSSTQRRLIESYLRFLMGMYHPEGFARLREGTRSLTLKLVWMTKDEVIQRYGDKS